MLVFYVYSLKILQRADRFDDLFIADICKLQVECPKHSFCDTTYIGSSSPPGSYQCVCDDGYSSSSKRPGNVVASGQKCTENPPSGKSTCKIRGILPYLLCTLHVDVLPPSLCLLPCGIFPLSKSPPFRTHYWRAPT